MSCGLKTEKKKSMVPLGIKFVKLNLCPMHFVGRFMGKWELGTKGRPPKPIGTSDICTVLFLSVQSTICELS